MELRGLLINVLLVGTFIFAMISVSVFLTSENNVNNTLMDNSAINSTFKSIETELQTKQSETNETKTSFEKDDVTIGDELTFGSIIGAGRKYGSMVIEILILPLVLVSQILNVNSIILGVIGAIILATIVFLAWSLYRTGK